MYFGCTHFLKMWPILDLSVHMEVAQIRIEMIRFLVVCGVMKKMTNFSSHLKKKVYKYRDV